MAADPSAYISCDVAKRILMSEMYHELQGA